jgi:hypothetical protein
MCRLLALIAACCLRPGAGHGGSLHAPVTLAAGVAAGNGEESPDVQTTAGRKYEF